MPFLLPSFLRPADWACPPVLHVEPRWAVADVPSPRTDPQPRVPASLPLRFKLLRTFLQQVLQGSRWLLRPLQLWPQRLQGLHGGLDGTRVQRGWERKLAHTTCRVKVWKMYNWLKQWVLVFCFVWFKSIKSCKILKTFHKTNDLLHKPYRINFPPLVPLRLKKHITCAHFEAPVVD